MREFDFSQAAIREGTLRVLALFLYMIPFCGAFALYISDFNVEIALKAMGVYTLVTGVILGIETPLLNWTQRRLKVLVYEDRLVKQCGRKEQIILWKDITRIKTVQNKKGGLAHITLYRKRPRMAVWLHGFTEMEDLANVIKESTPEGVLLQERRWKLDRQKPFATAPIVLVPTMAVMLVVVSIGSKAMDVFGISSAFLVGSGVLIFRPLTKSNVSLKWIELILAVVFLILGIRRLNCLLSLGRIP